MGLFNKKHSKTFSKEMDKQINRKTARKKNIIKLTSCRTTYIWVLWAFVGNLLRREKGGALFNTRSFLVFWMCNKKQKGENARETKKFIFLLR